MKISVVMPTLGRKSLKKCVDSLQDADEIILVKGRKKCVVDLYNEGYDRASGDVIFQTLDRVFYDKGWRKKVEKAFKEINNYGMVSFFEQSACASLLTRDYIEEKQLGYLYWPEYIHYFGDLEMAMVAKKHGFKQVEGVAHWIEKKETPIYPHEEARGEWDTETFQIRQGLDFPMILVRDMKERAKLL